MSTNVVTFLLGNNFKETLQSTIESNIKEIIIQTFWCYFNIFCEGKETTNEFVDNNLLIKISNILLIELTNDEIMITIDLFDNIMRYYISNEEETDKLICNNLIIITNLYQKYSNNDDIWLRIMHIFQHCENHSYALKYIENTNLFKVIVDLIFPKMKTGVIINQEIISSFVRILGNFTALDDSSTEV